MNDPEASINIVGNICAAFRIESLLPQLRASEEVLRGGGVVDVAVLGQFKAGKSSFLNSLIGKEIMPVNVLPATAVVTRLCHGPSDRAIVRHLGGNAEEIGIDRLADFVTEQRNPGNEKQVAIVEVELSSLEAYRGIRFVDTPGLGSIYKHNTTISMEWLPRVGGALLAVSVNHPLSEQDLKLLGEVSKHTPEAAILLTKADLVTDSQLDAVVEFTRRHVASHTGRELPILPYSIHSAFGSLHVRMREYLIHRIVERREEKFVEIMSHKIHSLTAGCKSYLHLALTAASAAEKARMDLREVFLREQRDIGSVRGEIRLFSRDQKTHVRSSAGERFYSYHREVTGRMKSDLREKLKDWKGNLARTTRDFQGWLAAALEEELVGVSAHGEKHLSGYLYKSRSSFHRTVRAFQDRLAKEIERALGISFEGARFHAEIVEPVRPDIRVGKTFDTNIDLLWFVIPMWLFRPLIRRHFLRRIPWEVEKNLSRLAAQWADSVNESIDDLARQALKFMQSELSTIEGLVANAGDRRADIQKALDELESLGRERINP